MQQKGPVSVLVAPLDWGLGHATRCIPVIRELISQGARVTIATSGRQKALLETEFPLLEFLEIPGYEIRYTSGILLKWGLLFRIPAILKQIQRENKWLVDLIQNRDIDAVISDNRYGLYYENLYCVFLTHQLFIQSGVPGIMGRWIDHKILKWNYRLIGKFSTCWVPDQPGPFSLAGKLSRPPWQLPIPVTYTGILSRFRPMEKRGGNNSLLILLSGPEPQRTRFEIILFSQLARTNRRATVIRGLPGLEGQVPFIREGIKIYNHLPSEALIEWMHESQVIICRSGYSTIMDLVQMKKNAILVPTPGQTEQEYLGRYLHERKWMYTVSQKKFKLEKALAAFQRAELLLPERRDDHLKEVIEDLIQRMTEKNSHGSEVMH